MRFLNKNKIIFFFKTHLSLVCRPSSSSSSSISWSRGLKRCWVVPSREQSSSLCRRSLSPSSSSRSSSRSLRGARCWMFVTGCSTWCNWCCFWMHESFLVISGAESEVEIPPLPPTPPPPRPAHGRHHAPPTSTP